MVCARLLALALIALTLTACSGSNGAAGAPGTPGLDIGTIAGTVKDSSGAPVAGVAIGTVPASTTATTDSSGKFTLANIPIGAYTVSASKTGYQTQQLTGVGVSAGATNQISITLATAPGAPGAVSGTIVGRQGVAQPSAPVAGASVCVEGASPAVCTSTQNDGTFTLANVAAGPAFLTATAAGFLPGETKEATFAGAAGVTITLSGMPSAAATYVGAARCVSCHTTFDPQVTANWQASAHAETVDHTLNHVDLNGWPAAPANCATPSYQDSKVQAMDPVSGNTIEVWLVRWPANCPGQAQFAMFFDTNGNGLIDPGETVIPVQGTQGGIATDGGQCGNGGLLPLTAYFPGTNTNPLPVPCSANFLSPPNPAENLGGHGYWQQEYLLNIGPGKPIWVNWDTSGTPQDMLVLPLAWNQRGQYWANAPDYNPTQQGTYAKVCGGCHETGPVLKTDANGNVTTYVAGSQNIACERCHGPGSDHVSSLDAKAIINPAYMTAQAQNEMCGQCHTNSMSSTQPAGAFDFAWNNQAAAGGGNFIPGVHKLSDFAQFPSYGDPNFYWAGGVFPSLDHMTFVDVTASVHNTNPYEKVTCVDCHEAHSLVGGAAQIVRADATGNQYVFQGNDTVLRNDVLCLACHATHEDFAAIGLEDVARYHVSQGTASAPTSVQLNGQTFAPSTTDQATSTALIANTVNAHMLSQAGMPAYFDPTALVNGEPVGRCSSCHMMKTAWTSNFLFSGPDANGKTADLAGDVSAHSFRVAGPQDSSLSAVGATDWSQIMPNACGTCHAEYRFGL